MSKGVFFQFTPESTAGPATSWQPFILNGGKELVLFDGDSKTLKRYELSAGDDDWSHPTPLQLRIWSYIVGFALG